MADDQPTTKVTVTRDSVSIEHPGGNPAELTAMALDILRRAHALPAHATGPAVGFVMQHQPGVAPHRDKRVGGELAPIRAEVDNG